MYHKNFYPVNPPVPCVQAVDILWVSCGGLAS
jgi:hypothetical protein